MLAVRTNIARGNHFSQELQRCVVNVSICMYLSALGIETDTSEFIQFGSQEK